MLPSGLSKRDIRAANRENIRNMNMQQIFSEGDVSVEAREQPMELADPTLPAGKENQENNNKKVSEELDLDDQQLEGAGAGDGDIVLDINASAGAQEGAGTSADARRRPHSLEGARQASRGSHCK